MSIYLFTHTHTHTHKQTWRHFEIDHKVGSELPKNKQELFTHCLEITSTNILLQVTKKMPRIFSATIKAHGGFFDEKKI